MKLIIPMFTALVSMCVLTPLFADTTYYCPQAITLTKLDSGPYSYDCAYTLPGGQQLPWQCKHSGLDIKVSQLPLTLQFSEAHSSYTAYDQGANCTYGDFPGGSKIQATVISTNALSPVTGDNTKWKKVYGNIGYHYECDSNNPQQCPMKQTFSKD
jgi:hypothetical protein